MWKCKKCGGEVIKIVTTVKEYRCDKKGRANELEFEYTHNIENECKVCGNKDITSFDIEDVAIWED